MSRIRIIENMTSPLLMWRGHHVKHSTPSQAYQARYKIISGLADNVMLSIPCQEYRGNSILLRAGPARTLSERYIGHAAPNFSQLDLEDILARVVYAPRRAFPGF